MFGTPRVRKKFVFEIFTDIKKSSVLVQVVQINWILGVHLGRFYRGGTPKLCQHFSSLNTYWYQKKWSLRLSRSKIDFCGFIWGFPGGGTLKVRPSICPFNILYYQKKLELYLKQFKKLIFGGSLWESPGVGTPKLCQNYLPRKYLLISNTQES